MKLTNKGRYAVQALADIASSEDGKPTNLTDISLRQGISISFLEQIFLKLKKRNLVKSQRGPFGGYILSKPSNEITLSSIIDAVDEKVKTVACKKDSKKGYKGPTKLSAFSNDFIVQSLCLCLFERAHCTKSFPFVLVD